MAYLKIFGIFIALCIIIAVAEEDTRTENQQSAEQYYHESINPRYPLPNRMALVSDDNLPFNGVHGQYQLQFSPIFGNTQESNEKLNKRAEFKLNVKHPFGNVGKLERRRPLFYPYLPYHFYYHPHVNPSSDDSEFETIEARASRNLQEVIEQLSLEFLNHGHHNPNFPLNSDNNAGLPIRPFDHHHHYHGHGKPSNSEEKPTDDTNFEGSGEEEIIPLSDSAKIPLIEGDTQVDDQSDEQDDVNDLESYDFIRSFLALSKASIAIDCDALNSPRYSCYNCWSYLVCKPNGGKIKACKDPLQPYCNNGICSAIPSEECLSL